MTLYQQYRDELAMFLIDCQCRNVVFGEDWVVTFTAKNGKQFKIFFDDGIEMHEKRDEGFCPQFVPLFVPLTWYPNDFEQVKEIITDYRP
jgi:hypothetical protein